MKTDKSAPAQPLCVVGIGAYTAVGLNAASTAAAVRAGVDEFEEHPFMLNRQGEPYVLAMAPAIEPTLIGADRYVTLATWSLQEALQPLIEAGVPQPPLTALVALPERRPGLPSALAEQLTQWLGHPRADHPAFQRVLTAHNGHSAGLSALATAGRLLSAGDSQFCLVGGIDSYTDPQTLEWLEQNEQLHTEINAWGFVPGEAAGFALVCTEQAANQYRMPIKARITAVTTKTEQHVIKSESVCIGEGLTQALRETLSALPPNGQVNQILCDQNGEVYRADEFGFMICRLSEHLEDVSRFNAPADCWGEVGAATGPLLLNLAIAAAERGYSHGLYTRVSASSEAGGRAAALYWR